MSVSHSWFYWIGKFPRTFNNSLNFTKNDGLFCYDSSIFLTRHFSYRDVPKIEQDSKPIKSGCGQNLCYFLSHMSCHLVLLFSNGSWNVAKCYKTFYGFGQAKWLRFGFKLESIFNTAPAASKNNARFIIDPKIIISLR